jgi:hypothetical protein
MRPAGCAFRYLTGAAGSVSAFVEEGRLIRGVIFKFVGYERLVADPAEERARRGFGLFWCPIQNP